MTEKSKDQEMITVLAQKLGLPKRVLRCKYDEQFHLIELKLSALEVSPPPLVFVVLLMKYTSSSASALL